MYRLDHAVTLGEAISGLSGRVLVAMDFDGVLAEIVDRPEDARPIPGAVDALVALARRPDTDVAVVSGRSIDDLIGFLDVPAEITLIGEHGAVWNRDEVALPEGFGRVLEVLEHIAGRHEGAWVERKTSSMVVHTRQLEHRAEQRAVREVVDGLNGLGHHRFQLGKRVVDVGFVDSSKGSAVDVLRTRSGVDAVVFAGDDTTDETVFERLVEGDIGVKVGEGPSAAMYRVAGPAEVVEVLLCALVDRPHD